MVRVTWLTISPGATRIVASGSAARDGRQASTRIPRMASGFTEISPMSGAGHRRTRLLACQGKHRGQTCGPSKLTTPVHGGFRASGLSPGVDAGERQSAGPLEPRFTGLLAVWLQPLRPTTAKAHPGKPRGTGLKAIWSGLVTRRQRRAYDRLRGKPRGTGLSTFCTKQVREVSL